MLLNAGSIAKVSNPLSVPRPLSLQSEIHTRNRIKYHLSTDFHTQPLVPVLRVAHNRLKRRVSMTPRRNGSPCEPV